jgi:hypothetical protein
MVVILVKNSYLNRLSSRSEVKEGFAFGFFPCLAHVAQAEKTLFRLDWLKIAGSAISSTRPGSHLPRSRVRLPTHSCGASSLPGGTKRINLPFVGLFLVVSVLPTLLSVFPGPRSPAGVTPIIWSLNLRNRPPWSGLNVKSPIVSPVEHHTTDTPSFLT